MQLGIFSRLLVRPELEQGCLLVQLPVNIDPLTHASRRQKMGTAPVGQLASAQPTRLLPIALPKRKITEKVRLLVAKVLLHLVCSLLRIQRPLAWILDAQRSRDHQHFTDTTLPPGLQQDPGNTRINRQTRKTTARFSQLASVIDRTQFMQQTITIVDEAPIRRIKKGKVLDLAQAHRLHLQDDSSQIGPQNLGVGKLRPGREVLFRVQTNADTRTQPATTARTLIRARLRNRLYRQPLHLGAITVTA